LSGKDESAALRRQRGDPVGAVLVDPREFGVEVVGAFVDFDRARLGGGLNGPNAKLEYSQGLGAMAVWMTPYRPTRSRIAVPR
jgi:hypothetical protein